MSRLADLAIENYMNQYVGRPSTSRSVDDRVPFTPNGAPATDPNAPPTSGTNPPPDTTAPPTTNTGTGGGTDLASFGTPRGIAGTGYSGYNYTGFDFNQDPTNRDIGKSAKYAFANATNKMGQAGVTAQQWGTKAGAQEVFTKYVVPEMEALGFKVLEIKGEKIRIVSYEDYQKGNTKGTWIDCVVNADGANPQLAWQPETAPDATDTGTSWTPTTATTTAGGTTTGAKTPTVTAGGDVPVTTPPVSAASGFVDDELLRGRSLADLVY